MALSDPAALAQQLFDFVCDLHVHTCLSPCGELDASPKRQVEAAARRGIDLIAVCDHNSAGNVAAAQEVAAGSGVVVLAGLEICSREEVHSVAVMPDLEAALAMQEWVWQRLTGRNNPEVFGLQVYANAQDEVEGYCDQLLISAAEASLDQVSQEVHRRGGLLIAAHIDREAYGVIGQLGFVPPATFDALEISRRANPADYRAVAAKLGLALLQSSDAHQPDEVGAGSSVLHMAHRTFDELAKALRNEAGRAVVTQ